MGGFDQRIEVIVKIQKSRGRGGGCDARIEAFLKMQNAKKKEKKKNRGRECM